MRRREVRGPQVEIGEDRGERRRQEERARVLRENAPVIEAIVSRVPPPPPLPPSPKRFNPPHPPCARSPKPPSRTGYVRERRGGEGREGERGGDRERGGEEER